MPCVVAVARRSLYTADTAPEKFGAAQHYSLEAARSSSECQHDSAAAAAAADADADDMTAHRLACGNKTLAPPCCPYVNCDRRTSAKAVLARMGDDGWGGATPRAPSGARLSSSR